MRRRAPIGDIRGFARLQESEPYLEGLGELPNALTSQPVPLRGTPLRGTPLRATASSLTPKPSPLLGHLNRPFSKSLDNLSKRSSRTRSSSIVTNPYEDPPNDDFFLRQKLLTHPASYAKHSPTPSIKRERAEKLLKEHGSPPGRRVTAGGRVVPDGFSPLPTPQFDYGGHPPPGQSKAFSKTLGLRNQPSYISNYANPYDLQSLEGFIVPLDDSGNYGQIVNGKLRPMLPNFHAAMFASPQVLFHPATMLAPSQTSGQAPGQQFQPNAIFGEANNEQNRHMRDSSDIPSAAASVAEQIRAKKDEHAKIQAQKADLDRNEVLQRKSITESVRQGIVRSRVQLTNDMDRLRREILELEKFEGSKRMRATGRHKISDQIAATTRSTSNQDSANTIGQQRADGLTNASFVEHSYGGPNYPALSSGHYGDPNRERHAQYGIIPEKLSRGSASQPFGILEERVENIGLGVNNNIPFASNSPMEILKIDGNPYGISAPRSMNLDGSAHQPRRSHAVPIKDPKENSAKQLSSLNPTSPIYEPSKIATSSKSDDDEVSHFEPSSLAAPPVIVSDEEATLRLNEDKARHMQNAADSAPVQPSDSSASTSDFFPHNTDQHSAIRYHHQPDDLKVNLASWMHGDVKPDTGSTGTETFDTVNRMSQKHRYVSHEGQETALPDAKKTQHELAGKENSSASLKYKRSCDLDIVTQAQFTRISQQDKEQQSTHLREATVTAEDENIVPVAVNHDADLSLQTRDSPLHRPYNVPRLSEAYLNGFRDGVTRTYVPWLDADYASGYREGVKESTRTASPRDKAPSNEDSANPQFSVTPTAIQFNGERLLGFNKTQSWPSMSQPNKVPENSLSSTPQKPDMIDAQPSPLTPRNTDISNSFSKRAADFESIPNVNVAQNPASNAEKIENDHEPASTSPTRSSRLFNGLRQQNPQQLSVHAYTNNRGNFDRQRYQKSRTSPAAQTSSHARGCFSSQLDGSEDDDIANRPAGQAGQNKARVQASNSPSSPSSPSKKEKTTKDKSSKSPVKSRASAAMTKMGQLAGGFGAASGAGPGGLSKKGEMPDPAPISTPEKEKWRTKWKVRFEKVKEADESQIA